MYPPPLLLWCPNTSLPRPPFLSLQLLGPLGGGGSIDRGHSSVIMNRCWRTPLVQFLAAESQTHGDYPGPPHCAASQSTVVACLSLGPDLRGAPGRAHIKQ